jgi:7 transmembrane helices usually fused to an inactive transglutaminase
MVTAMARSSPRAARWTVDHWRFLATTLAPAIVLTLGRLPALPTSAYLAKHLTLSTVPLSLQHTLTHILLVPLGALLVVFARLTLGIHVLGPFRSILLAFAFLATGLALGLVFLAATVLILVLARPLVSSLRLPYFGRVSVMISAVAVVMVMGTLAGGWLRSASLRNVAQFPIVVLLLVGEKVAVTIRRDGIHCGLWRAATTTLIGMALTGVAAIPGLEQLLLRRPELLLVEIAPIVVVSTLGTWRLLEAINPEPKTAHPQPPPPAGQATATSQLTEARS